jgi:hypothetical protein
MRIPKVFIPIKWENELPKSKTVGLSSLAHKIEFEILEDRIVLTELELKKLLRDYVVSSFNIDEYLKTRKYIL